MIRWVAAFAGALAATAAWAQPLPPIIPTAPAGTNSNQAASTAFVQSAVALGTGGMTVGTTAVNGGTSGGVLYDNAGVVGMLPGTSGGIIYFNGTNTVASSTVLTANGIVLGGGAGAAPSTMAGTSGGIPYFNGTNTAASSAALTATGIVVGGGAGAAPTTALCTIDTNPAFSCASGSSSFPIVQLTNSTSDTSSPNINFSKNRTGANTLSGDIFGALQFIGFANSAQRTAAQIYAKQNGASSGSNIPTDLYFVSSSSAGLLNQNMIYDHNGHLNFVAAAAPTITAGCNGTGSSMAAGSTDAAGTIIGQTASATSCVLTFAATYTSPPHCTLGSWNGSLATITTGVSTLTINFSAVTSPKFSYQCFGL